jgi:hypothetical protein
MSNVTICDECGKVDEGKHQGDGWYHISGSGTDLCPDCYRKKVDEQSKTDGKEQ